MVLGLALAAAALPACLIEKEERYDFQGTPAGLAFAWENVGAVPAWYSVRDIHGRFEQATERAVSYLAPYGATEAEVREIARANRHVSFDACRFKTPASPTGWAAGSWVPDARMMLYAFWSRAKADVVPPEAPAWTAYTWGELRPSPRYDYGVPDPSFPACGHEFGHAWATRRFGRALGAKFEHGWTPPLVNPSGPALLAEAARPGRDWSRDCVVVE